MSHFQSTTPGILRIWQQNLNKSLTAQDHLLNSANLDKYDLIMIQEPYLDRMELTRASRNWVIVYPSTKTTDGHDPIRSIILANSNIASAGCQQIPIMSSDVTAIRLDGEFGSISFINAYIDCTHNNTLNYLQDCVGNNIALFRPTDEDGMILLGDFNRHHPLWEVERSSHLYDRKDRIEPLIELIITQSLEMALPKGIEMLEAMSTRNWTRPDNGWRTSNLEHLFIK